MFKKHCISLENIKALTITFLEGKKKKNAILLAPW